MRERVVRAARDGGLDVKVAPLEAPTKTVEQAAAAVGCVPAQIAKSIVVVADGEPVVCVTSGAHRVDVRRVCDVTDSAEARQATPEEVRAATGFSVGGVPPIGHDLPVLFDEALLEHERVWAAGGDGNTLFAADPRALARSAGARVAPIGGA